jgi:hypothetical protein
VVTVVSIALIAFVRLNETPTPSPPMESAAREFPFPPPLLF